MCGRERFQWQAKIARQNIAGTRGDHTQRRFGVHHSLQYIVHGAIPAAGDKGIEPGCDGTARLLSSPERPLALHRRSLDPCALQDAEDALDQGCPPRPISAGGAIVDDQSSAHAMKNGKV
jgi:hypothetical protein